jgi:hypothetical protein
MRVSQFLEKLPFGSDRRKEQILNAYEKDFRMTREELEELAEKNKKYLRGHVNFDEIFEKNTRKREEEEDEIFLEDEEEIEPIEEEEEEEKKSFPYDYLNALSLAHQSIRQDDPELARLIRHKMAQILDQKDQISLTERARQLFPFRKLTQKELFDIGKYAKEAYLEKYGRAPAQKLSYFDGQEKWSNYYTRKDLGIMDGAIRKVI